MQYSRQNMVMSGKQETSSNFSHPHAQKGDLIERKTTSDIYGTQHYILK